MLDAIAELDPISLTLFVKMYLGKEYGMVHISYLNIIMIPWNLNQHS